MAKAKKKKEPIEEIKVEENTVVESVEQKAVISDVDDFVAKQLMAINKMPDRAKARRLAERVLSRKRKG